MRPLSNFRGQAEELALKGEDLAGDAGLMRLLSSMAYMKGNFKIFDNMAELHYESMRPRP